MLKRTAMAFLLSISTLTAGASAAFAQTSFENARATYNGLHRSAESQIAALEAELRANAGPLQDQIKALEKERDNCATFDCAQRVSEKIRDSRGRLASLTEPYLQKENSVRASLVQSGRELAVDAYATEVSNFLREQSEWRLLSVVENQMCGQEPLGHPSKNIVCKMSTLEFRVGPIFYRTKLVYGLPILPDPEALVGLEQLFGKSRAEFLAPELESGDTELRAGLTQLQASLNARLEPGTPEAAYSFSLGSRMGYYTIAVEQTP